MKINILLGAGFSIEAGYPGGQTLNQKFFSNVERKILRQSWSEWMWDEYDGATSNNGRLNFEYLNVSYLLSELVETYQLETGLVFDYEEFYDWFLKKYGDIDFIKACCKKVNDRFKANFNLPKTSSHYFKHPDINEYRVVFEAYNYLIADLLRRPYDREGKIGKYLPFIDLIRQSDEVNIFTLNHDTLPEFLLAEHSIRFSDGFSAQNSIIVGENKSKLPIFVDQYPENVRLYKLHGSVSYYLFTELNPNQGGVYHDTGKYWFFKPGGHWNQQIACKIDPETGEIVQGVNSNILPQFLTGKSKMNLINDHLVYKPIYDRFCGSFQELDALFIIGYSFRDVHINKIIKQAIDQHPFKVINVNPHAPFPFRRNYSNANVENVESMIKMKLK